MDVRSSPECSAGEAAHAFGTDANRQGQVVDATRDGERLLAPTQARRTEVDFLLIRGAELLALEVKSSKRFSRSWLSGLKAIGELDRVVRRVIVYLGAERLRTDEGIEAWPLELFLEQLEAGSLWP